MAEKNGLTYKECNIITEIFLDTMKDCLANGESFMLSGYFSIDIKPTKSRKSINPSTKEFITIPAHYVPKCTFSTKIKELVAKLPCDNKIRK